MDLWPQTCADPGPPLTSDMPAAGTETQLAATIVGLIRGAQKPVILIGTEVARYGLADAVADLIAKLGVRWASDMLSKSTLAETGAGWIGVYDPPYVPQAIRTQVESADLLVTLGCVYPNSFAPLVAQKFANMVAVYDGRVRIGEPAQTECRDPGAGGSHADQGRRAAACERSCRCGADGSTGGCGHADLQAGIPARRYCVGRDTDHHPGHVPRHVLRGEPARERQGRVSVRRGVGVDRPFGRRCGRRVLRFGQASARHLR